MIDLPFASFCNRYSGQEGWVVGRGPTRFSYEELARVKGPVFFVNDAVGQEKWLPEGHPAFFFAHDAAMGGWLFQKNLRSVPVLIVDQPVTGPPEQRRPGLISGPDDPRLADVAQAIFYRKDGSLDRTSLLSRSREEIAGSGQLQVGSGTIHPLIHFAWYVGCPKLHFVGCDGLPGFGYDPRLENRSASSQQQAVPIRVRQEQMLRQLAVSREYVGTPTHYLEMTLEIRVAPESQGRLLAWAESLLAIFRSYGCRDLDAHDFTSQAKGYWIRGLWPDIEPCVECQLSAAYREALRAALEPQLGGSRDNLRIAYRAGR